MKQRIVASQNIINDLMEAFVRRDLLRIHLEVCVYQVPVYVHVTKGNGDRMSCAVLTFRDRRVYR